MQTVCSFVMLLVTRIMCCMRVCSMRSGLDFGVWFANWWWLNALSYESHTLYCAPTHLQAVVLYKETIYNILKSSLCYVSDRRSACVFNLCHNYANPLFQGQWQSSTISRTALLQKKNKHDRSGDSGWSSSQQTNVHTRENTQREQYTGYYLP